MARRSGWSVAAGVLALAAVGVSADDWPAWRGPDGSGRTREAGLPIKWTATENVRWRTALPGPGNGTPIVSKGKVFLTQSLDPQGRSRALMAFDRATGKLLWQQAVPFEGKESTHGDNPYCAGSAATDGERVVANLGSAGMICCSQDGKVLWRAEVGILEHIWGNSATPVFYKDLVITNLGPGERQFLLALDRRTGREVWRVDEPGGKAGLTSRDWVGSWSTPAIVKVNGRDELIQTWPHAVKAYDPASGRLLWTCAGLTPLVYTSPLVSPERVIAMCGYGGSWLAVRPGGSGDVTETHRLWRVERAQQRIGSGVILGDRIYMVNEPGVLQVIDSATGIPIAEHRVSGSTWSSLLAAGDRLYSINRQGETTVFSTGTELKILSRNPLNEKTHASIAPSNGELFIRTYQALYCISEKKG